jgi:hypothetical protein
LIYNDIEFVDLNLHQTTSVLVFYLQGVPKDEDAVEDNEWPCMGLCFLTAKLLVAMCLPVTIMLQDWSLVEGTFDGWYWRNTLLDVACSYLQRKKCLSPLQQPGLQSALVEGSEFQAIQDCNVIFQDLIEVWQLSMEHTYMFKSLKSGFQQIWMTSVQLLWAICKLQICILKGLNYKLDMMFQQLGNCTCFNSWKSQDDSSVFLEVSTDNINFYSPSKFHLHSRNLVQSIYGCIRKRWISKVKPNINPQLGFIRNWATTGFQWVAWQWLLVHHSLAIVDAIF